jgi:hypothetical protein
VCGFDYFSLSDCYLSLSPFLDVSPCHVHVHLHHLGRAATNAIISRDFVLALAHAPVAVFIPTYTETRATNRGLPSPTPCPCYGEKAQDVIPIEEKDDAAKALLSRQQVAADSKHLRADVRRKAIHLSRILLHLSRIEKRLEPARLLGELEQSLPLIFRKRGLFCSSACGIFGLPLLLPCSNLSLFSRK